MTGLKWAAIGLGVFILVGIVQTVLDIIHVMYVPAVPAPVVSVLGWVLVVGFLAWVRLEWIRSHIERGP